MSSLPKELQSTVRIQFQDCDPFRHLNNARYIDYFLNTRQQQLETFYGFRIFDPAQFEAKSWVSIKNQIAYLSPATVLEDVSITTRLIQFNQRTLLVEGLMAGHDGYPLKAVIWMEFMYVDPAAMRPATHDDDLMRFFGDVHWAELPLDASQFDARVQTLRRLYKKAATAEPIAP